ncbi:MAG TPA: YjbH domain-containing protein [Burkholderiaceae bacterium]|nr:YjbH domain-containing protein [Burkholderiaceae bacterium]
MAAVASPFVNPVLFDGHSVHLYPRPAQVAVILSSGQVCLVPHRTLAWVADYLAACSVSHTASVQTAWVAQPTGHTQSVGLAPWNVTAQPHVAPGAWIWAPASSLAVAPQDADNLIRFLATQPPLEFLTNHPLRHLAIQVSEPSQATAPATDPQVSFSDWGEAGLLQTPSARMAPSGHARVHFSNVQPYTRGNFMFQPLDWFEFGFRYTGISNRLYGPEDFSGQQSLKDKSIDVKLRLSRESAQWPQIALGVRDLGGTGLFSAEYLVASKRWGAVDASLGLGWGYVGARGNIRNPLSRIFGASWAQRPVADVGEGGTVGLSKMFKGPVALFGGIQYTLSPQVLLKAELDGNHYQSEPQANNQKVNSRFNFGLTYRQSPSVDWSVGIERGNRLMLGLTLQTDGGGLGGMAAPKVLDAPLPPIVSMGSVPAIQRSMHDILEDLSSFTGWQARVIRVESDTVFILAEATSHVFIQDRVDRAIQYLNAQFPSTYKKLVIQLRELGMPMATLQVNREEWLSARHQVRTPGSRLAEKELFQGSASGRSFPTLKYRNYSLDVGPSFSSVLGGPDGFWLYSVGIQVNGELRIDRGAWISGTLNLRLLDNFDRYRVGGWSDLPPVRTNQREYALSSRITLPTLQLTHVADMGNGHYASAYAGMLESMFGGIGAEWYHRPWLSPFAWGIDINHVRQRGFRQNLALKKYRVTTGHLTTYWDTGFQGIHVTASAGRYLAGDIGATLDIKRVFDNGVALGVWATKTNVSAAQFGEGSFDKGIYLSVPFDVMLPRSATGASTLLWRPLTRDGGAKLARKFTLDDITRLRSPTTWRINWPGKADDKWFTQFSDIALAPPVHPLSNIGQTTRTLGAQVAAVPASTWLAAGGAVLASSLLDKRADRWATNHQGGSWRTMGNLTSAVPFLLAGGAGALYLGLAGPDHATVAETSIRAAGYTLASGLALKYAVGRNRPSTGLGPTQFSGFNGKAFNSSFASIHTSVAFALATPFAQQHNQPWLYGLAATTAFGRIQKRDHWVSDTVGGALLGYAIGSLLSAQQTAADRPVSFSVTPNAVVANWKY